MSIYNTETLDRGIIHIRVGHGKISSHYPEQHATRNSWTVCFWNFPFNNFNHGLPWVTETEDKKDYCIPVTTCGPYLKTSMGNFETSMAWSTHSTGPHWLFSPWYCLLSWIQWRMLFPVFTVLSRHHFFDLSLSHWAPPIFQPLFSSWNFLPRWPYLIPTL